MKKIQKVLVVGAGTMGHGIAQLFALRDFDVKLLDRSEDILGRARSQILQNLNLLVELGEINPAQVEKTMAHIGFDTNLSKAAGDIDFVIEAVYEDLTLKKQIFKQLDSVAVESTILASNTSSFDINELIVNTRYPVRIIGTHWYFPPQIIPCVEVVPASRTSSSTVEVTMELMKRIGKKPTLAKSAPGFVGNRIQYAMLAEAFAIVEEGLATVEEVDTIVKTSFGFRLGAYGPFQICDHAGADTIQSVFKYLHKKLNKDHFKPPRLLHTMVQNEDLGLKTGLGFYKYNPSGINEIKIERDKKLYARLSLFNRENSNKEEKR
jgi:3-hydroxybutyryl-CoA dehydrogenase